MPVIKYPFFNERATTTCEPLIIQGKEPELGQFEITGTGNIEIRNTGGSSASEGGMGDSGGAEKGAGITDNGGATKDKETTKESFGEEKWDPVRSDDVKKKENG